MQENKETVLVIDDDPEFLEMVSDYLRWSGYFVLSTSSTEEAWSIVADKTKPVHALLCDIELPAQSGTAFLAKMRDAEIKIPTILMTGFFDVDHQAARKLGAQAALIKPLDLRFLAGLIRSHLRNSGNESAS